MAAATPANPITAEHAAKFEECVKKWQVVFGLQDWRINVSKTRSRRKNVVAECPLLDLEQRLATIKLGTDWRGETPDDKTIDSSALHEVQHIFMHELIEVCKVPDQEQDVIRSAEHRIINTYERLFAEGRLR